MPRLNVLGKPEYAALLQSRLMAYIKIVYCETQSTGSEDGAMRLCRGRSDVGVVLQPTFFWRQYLTFLCTNILGTDK